MSRVGQIIANMPEKMAKAVLHQREIHACLMELDREARGGFSMQFLTTTTDPTEREAR